MAVMGWAGRCCVAIGTSVEPFDVQACSEKAKATPHNATSSFFMVTFLAREVPWEGVLVRKTYCEALKRGRRLGSHRHP
jgi:hypothetical protein